jgi:hypothetical protein
MEPSEENDQVHAGRRMYGAVPDWVEAARPREGAG